MKDEQKENTKKKKKNPREIKEDNTHPRQEKNKKGWDESCEGKLWNEKDMHRVVHKYIYIHTQSGEPMMCVSPHDATEENQ